MLLECKKGVDLTDVSWQFIPGLRSSDNNDNNNTVLALISVVI